MDLKEFEFPSPDKRGLTFWSLNGLLEENELKRQVGILRLMGFVGAFIHSRTGLETEYLGDEWFALVGTAAEELKRNGLEAWLYDEDRWPSGTCGGRVTAEKKFRLRSYVFHTSDIPVEAKGAAASFAVKFSDGKLEEVKPAEEFISGDTFLWFTVEEAEESDFYNGNTYVDLMNGEAVDAFLDSTHEKYREKLGGLFSELAGMFTDEPHRGCFLNGFGQTGEFADRRIPYSPGLEALYRELWGEELRSSLPWVVFRGKDESFSPAAYRYHKAVITLFERSFGRKYSAWCRKNGLLLTGHLLEENSLAGIATMCGDMMAMYKDMDCPGIDILGTSARPYASVKSVNSVKEQFGKTGALSEMYGATGWQTRFQTYKEIGDWQAILGITKRCAHLSWYTMKGEAKRDYPASIFFQSAWYPVYSYVEDYFARINVALSGDSCTELLVLHPVESAWGMIGYKTLKSFFVPAEKEFAELERQYKEVCEALLFGGVPFDYGDELLMAGHCRISGNRLFVGRKSYSQVLIAGLKTIRRSTLDILRDFAAGGGEVVVAGEKPRYMDGEACDVDTSGFLLLPYDLKMLTERYQRAALYEVSGENALSCLKKQGDSYVGAILNVGEKKGVFAFTLKRGLKAQRLDVRTGQVRDERFELKDGQVKVTLELEGKEEAFLYFSEALLPVRKEEYEEGALVPLPERFEYALGEDNVLVLDCAECRLDGEYFGKDECIRLDKKLRQKLNFHSRGRDMLQPWYMKKAGIKSREKHEISLRFEFENDGFRNEIRLAGEHLSDSRVTFNGALADTSETTRDFVDGCFEAAALRGLKEGRNVLEISFAFDELADLENYYILGGFAAEAGYPGRIGPPPEKLALGNLAASGFPFYGGSVDYILPLAEGEYRFEGTGTECPVLELIGAERKTVAFRPYVERLEVKDKLTVRAYLSRKNTFGPLHCTPSDPPSTVPAHYLIEGERYCRDFVLLAQGITSFNLYSLKRKEKVSDE